jgi:RecA-family ATPase
MSQLPVQPAWRLADCPEQQRWLVDGLWSEEAVGIIGGEPKCCKSFLALDLAVAVAAGVPCLRRFAVSRPGRVLLYPAEDALHIVRRRLEGICAAVGTALAELDVQVITAPSLRLDLEADRARLEQTVATLKPRFLILDPFVRLHRIDENVSGDVAPLLAFLRELQRRHAVAIAVVHHARKGAGTLRAGQALRGSSEFHAWGDSNLYLRRDTDDRIALTVEHRAAAAIAGITLALTQRDNALALQPVDAELEIEPRVQATSIDQRIAAALAEGEQPRTFAELRASCRVRAKTLYQRIAAMTAAGIITKSANGFTASPNAVAPRHRAAATSRFRFPHSLQPTGSGSGKPIKIRDRNTIKERDRAQYLEDLSVVTSSVSWSLAGPRCHGP